MPQEEEEERKREEAELDGDDDASREDHIQHGRRVSFADTPAESKDSIYVAVNAVSHMRSGITCVCVFYMDMDMNMSVVYVQIYVSQCSLCATFNL